MDPTKRTPVPTSLHGVTGGVLLEIRENHLKTSHLRSFPGCERQFLRCRCRFIRCRRQFPECPPRFPRCAWRLLKCKSRFLDGTWRVVKLQTVRRPPLTFLWTVGVDSLYLRHARSDQTSEAETR